MRQGMGYGQPEFNFGQMPPVPPQALSPESVERERIAEQYGIIGDARNRLVKKGNQWFYGNQPVEEWHQEMKELDAKDGDYKNY